MQSRPFQVIVLSIHIPTALSRRTIFLAGSDSTPDRTHDRTHLRQFDFIGTQSRARCGGDDDYRDRLAGDRENVQSAAERLLGYAAPEVIDQQSPALWHDANEVSARAAELTEQIGRTIPPGFEVFVIEAAGEVGEQREWTFIRKDGHRFPVQLVVSAIRDPSGEITGYLGTAQDLTERVKAEQERDRFFELAQDLLCIANAEGFFLRINPAFSRIWLVGIRATY